MRTGRRRRGPEAGRPVQQQSRLIRLWSTADGDPNAFSQALKAPAYWARKAVQNLVRLSTPGDGGEPLKLAARFIHKDKHASRLFLSLWSTAHDTDAFAEHLLAPAFRQEGRTELRLSHVPSLTGLRHLTMLTSLSLDWCEKGTDFTEVGELTGLTDLRITGREDIEDLTPIGRLPQLTHLSLSGCRAVEDTEPLLSLNRLRELNLSGTSVRSAHGFSQAFPRLESLNLRYCQSFTDVDGLAGLRSLTHLEMNGFDQLRDLSPFAALPRLESLGLNDCAGLTTLEGLGAHPRLTKLGIHGFPGLRTLEGLGEQPALRELSLTGCPALTDLSDLGRLPALHNLLINGTAVGNLDGLAGSPLSTLTLLYMRHLDSLSALRECTGLRELTLRDCPLVEDIPTLSLSSLSLDGAGWTDLSRLAGQRSLRALEVGTERLEDLTPLTGLPHLSELDLSPCRSLKDIRPLLSMPSLAHVQLPNGTWCFTTSGTSAPVVAELRDRGPTVTLLH